MIDPLWASTIALVIVSPRPGSSDRLVDRGSRPEEAIEQMRLIDGRNAEARIGDLEERLPVLERRAHGDASAGGRELDRIRDEVVHHLRESIRIALNLPALRPDSGSARSPWRLRPDEQPRRTQTRAHRGRRRGDRGQALRPRLPRRAADRRRARATGSALLCTTPRNVCCAAVKFADFVVLEQFEIADDRGQWRSQLVGDRRDEVAPESHQLLGARCVVTIDPSRPSLKLELPDQQPHEQRGSNDRACQCRPCPWVRHSCITRQPTALDVDQRFEPIEPAIDCSLLDRRCRALRTRASEIRLSSRGRRRDRRLGADHPRPGRARGQIETPRQLASSACFRVATNRFVTPSV